MSSSQNKVTPQYYEYLTEIEKGKENPVINLAVALLNHKPQLQEQINIADFGCFNGAMLDQIYRRLPGGLKTRVKLYGYDNNTAILKEGCKRFPYINFINVDIRNNINTSQTYKLVILSNILHEVYSATDSHDKGEEAVKQSLRIISETLDLGGDLIWLDGLKPNKSKNIVTVVFSDIQRLEDLHLLKRSNYKAPISFTENKDGSINISLLNLGTYLTKAKYLHRDFWGGEAQQTYQYFTLKEYQTLLNKCGFHIMQAIPQPSSPKSGVTIIEPKNMDLPAKSILIHARKI